MGVRLRIPDLELGGMGAKSMTPSVAVGIQALVKVPPVWTLCKHCIIFYNADNVDMQNT